MAISSPHPSAASRSGQAVPSDTIESSVTILATGYARLLARANRACCCSAQPSVVVILPPVLSRAHRTELLLCMHHYRTARISLEIAGATAVDADGRILMRPPTAATPTRC
jgi:hypothetical protein